MQTQKSAGVKGHTFPEEGLVALFSILGNGPILSKPGHLDGDYIAQSEEF